MTQTSPLPCFSGFPSLSPVPSFSPPLPGNGRGSPASGPNKKGGKLPPFNSAGTAHLKGAQPAGNDLTARQSWSGRRSGDSPRSPNAPRSRRTCDAKKPAAGAITGRRPEEILLTSPGTGSCGACSVIAMATVTFLTKVIPTVGDAPSHFSLLKMAAHAAACLGCRGK